jgi:hypothetical protein
MGSYISIQNGFDRTIYVKFVNSNEVMIGVSLGLMPFFVAAGAIGGAIGVGAAVAGQATAGISLAASLVAEGFHTVEKGGSYQQKFSLSYVQDCLISYLDNNGNRVDTIMKACWSAPTDGGTYTYEFRG